ncbi:hypothetical protein K470DRAFT_119125 [Piedraia hortae CBS 480.64]|uniref:Uncharacterized protein n=1 Tax=Piedraia hortae CBS 480.64 TaxID=1314780 RepID=A0A6A7BTW2_9PEZI|nr:hypothetical protein K470DRAFT_119125 [Piedraia hortae CBS 480.64]
MVNYRRGHNRPNPFVSLSSQTDLIPMFREQVCIFASDAASRGFILGRKVCLRCPAKQNRLARAAAAASV